VFTRIEGRVSDEVFRKQKKHFNDKELVNLTLAITQINVWNRFNVAFRNVAGSYQPNVHELKENRIITEREGTIYSLILLSSTQRKRNAVYSGSGRAYEFRYGIDHAPAQVASARSQPSPKRISSHCARKTAPLYSEQCLLLSGVTMSLSAVIVDDEQLARDELAYLLKNADDVNVVAQGKNGLEAVNLIKEHNPDLVFLDVQMPGLDGFGVIKKLLDKKIPLPKIVFATAFDQYAVKAFEVNAVDYLLKPFDKKRVAQAIQKARTKQGSNNAPGETFETLMRMLESQKQPAAKVLLRTVGRMFLVDQKDICYAWIEDGVITVVTAGAAGMEGQSNCRTLEELLDSLDPNLFWRAHRSYLVNINRIREVVPWFKSSYQLRMDDKKQTEVPVSRAQTKRLRELFGL